MPATELITPSTIVKDKPAAQDAATPYDWARQVRIENVGRNGGIVKETRPRNRRPQRASAARRPF